MFEGKNPAGLGYAEGGVPDFESRKFISKTDMVVTINGLNVDEHEGEDGALPKEE